MKTTLHLFGTHTQALEEFNRARGSIKVWSTMKLIQEDGSVDYYRGGLTDAHTLAGLEFNEIIPHPGVAPDVLQYARTRLRAVS